MGMASGRTAAEWEQGEGTMDGDAKEGDGRAERCRGGGGGEGEGRGGGGTQAKCLTSRSLCTRAGMSTYTCACMRVCGVH